MAIETATRKAIRGAFLDAVPLATLDAREWAGYQFELAADLLPEPEGQAWALIGRGADAVLLLFAGETLFTLTREAQAAGDALEVVVVSHPAKVAEVRYRREDRRTFWEFKFRSRDPLPIEGRIDHPAHPDDPETFDQRETLARALAGHAGWDP